MSLIKAYERIERHQAVRSLAPFEPDLIENSPAQTTSGHGAARDPLADLLETPLRDLAAPLAVESSVLDVTIYLVANDHQAATVRATGGIPYTAAEVDILWELYQALGPEVWPARLRLIHEGKRRLGGTVTGYTEGEDPCPI